jgi:hypothetical protein
MVKAKRPLGPVMGGMLALLGIIMILDMTVRGVLADTNITNLPGGISTGLGISTLAGQLLVCAAIVLSATLVMTVARAPFPIQLIVDIVLVGFLTVMGWLDIGIFMVLLLLIAILFAGTFVPKLWGGGWGG